LAVSFLIISQLPGDDRPAVAAIQAKSDSDETQERQSLSHLPFPQSPSSLLSSCSPAQKCIKGIPVLASDLPQEMVGDDNMINSKRGLTLLVSLTLIMALIMPATAAQAPNGAEYDRKISIVHTNDQHGIVDGEQYVKGLADTRKATGEFVLTVNAGDVIQGEPINALTKGESVVKIMNAARYDVLVPGNNEFVSGLDHLLELRAKMAFPVIAADYFDADGHAVFDPYIIKESGEIKVGIFGLTAPPEGNPYEAAKKCVSELNNKGCDIIIALVHLGVGNANNFSGTGLAEKVPGIDLVVDGHSHTALEKGIPVGNTIVVQAGEKLNYIGVAELYINNNKIVDKKASLIDRATYTSTIKPDATVAALIAEELAAIDKITATVIGKTPHSLEGERKIIRTSETNLGDMVVDSMRWKTNADIAILQGSMIRASIAAGDITINSVLRVLPMGAIVTVVEAPGRFLLDVLEDAVKSYPDPSPGFLQVSGLSYSFNPSGSPGKRVTEVVTDKEKTFNPEARYKVALPDKLVEDMQKRDYRETVLGKYGDYAEIFIDYLKSNCTIPKDAAGRIQIKQADSR
jgi:2',3'-cyclic-nucleotide 2'-phosphodiesterase (5'-nucleotidase family)